MASRAGLRESQSAAAVPVPSPLEGPQPQGAVGHLAYLCTGDQPEPAKSRGPLAQQPQVWVSGLLMHPSCVDPSCVLRVSPGHRLYCQVDCLSHACLPKAMAGSLALMHSQVNMLSTLLVAGSRCCITGDKQHSAVSVGGSAASTCSTSVSSAPSQHAGSAGQRAMLCRCIRSKCCMQPSSGCVTELCPMPLKGGSTSCTASRKCKSACSILLES